jgi:nitric oxide reductase subunit B
VTVSHGHLAFYGAYALVNLTFFYFALPRLKRFPTDEYRAGLGHWAFWVMSVSLLGMSLAFAVAGVLQSYLERAQAQPYMVAQQPIRFWMFLAFVHGVGVLAGAGMAIVHLLTLRPLTAAPAGTAGAG